MYALKFATYGRPKVDLQETKRNPRFEQVEIMGLLDQCKRITFADAEILREDKIFIRNKIKENDQETLNIFRKHRKPACDLQTLQIQLRKHVASLKNRFKNEQLMKFKENLCEGYCGCEKPRKVTEHDGSSRKPLKTQTSEGKENNYRNRLKGSLNMSEGKRRTLDNSYGKKPNRNFYSSLKPNQTIKELSAEREVTSRSKTQFGGGRQYCKTVSNLESLLRSDEKVRSWRQKTLPSEKKDIDNYWNEQYNKYIGGRKDLEKEYMKGQAKHEEDSIQEKLENFSVNISDAQLDNGQVNIRLPTFEGDTYQDQNDLAMYEFEKGIEKAKQATPDLFTSPQLLQQCRNILNRQSETNLNPLVIKESEQLPVSNKSKQSERQRSISKGQTQKVQINLDEGIQVDTIIEEQAEDLFDWYFFGGKSCITRHIFQRTTEAHCQRPQKYMDLFDLADKDQDGVITADALGAVLSTRCRSKPNTVKDVYSLIDIEKNGWFTTTDLERFMNQITEADSPEDSAIRTVVNRLFKNADVGNRNKVDYWSLYLTKHSNEFQQFTEYLEQFEFQIEV